jgi:hypothetical protein
VDHRRRSAVPAYSFAEDGTTLITVHPSSGPGLYPEDEAEFMDCPTCKGDAFKHWEACATCGGRGFI